MVVAALLVLLQLGSSLGCPCSAIDFGCHARKADIYYRFVASQQWQPQLNSFSMLAFYHDNKKMAQWRRGLDPQAQRLYREATWECDMLGLLHTQTVAPVSSTVAVMKKAIHQLSDLAGRQVPRVLHLPLAQPRDYQVLTPADTFLLNNAAGATPFHTVRTGGHPLLPPAPPPPGAALEGGSLEGLPPAPVPRPRCADWDLLCATDWVLTIQSFWTRYGDRGREPNWTRMLAVYQDRERAERWQASLSPGVRRYFGGHVTAEAIIQSMKRQIRRPDWGTVGVIVRAMRSLDRFSQQQQRPRSGM